MKNTFRECYVRTSCEDFDLEQDNLDKVYVHLTNNAIQKTSDNYGKFEDGNQISLGELSVSNYPIFIDFRITWLQLIKTRE